MAGDGERGPAAEAVPGRWRFGRFEVDATRGEVRRDGVVLPLERSAQAVLVHLVAHAGRVVGKDELLKAGWPARIVSENSLAKAIGRLRHALDDRDAELIRAVHGYGYRLVADVEALGRVAEPALAGVAGERVAASARARRWVPALAFVAAGALLLGMAWSRGRGQAEPAPQPSVATEPGTPVEPDVFAVLPLRDLSADGSLGALADGIAHHLRERLQHFQAGRIVNRADSQALRDDPRDGAQKARALGATLLIDGDIARDADRLRVTVRMHDALARVPPWSHVVERAASDQATLLDELRAALLAELAAQPWRDGRGLGRGTTNDEARRTFLRAATLFGGNNDPNSQRRALAVLEQAIELDPDYADAWFMLGGILGGSGYYADSTDELVAGRRRALTAMTRGLELVPQAPLEYLLRSEQRLLYAFDWAGAEADLATAKVQTPGGESAQTAVWEARLRASQSRLDEAIALDARAIMLDPQSGARRNQGWHYLAVGDTRNARAVLVQQLADLPENPHVNFYLALCDILDGQPQPALRRFEHSSTLFRLVGSAIARHELGDRAGSDLALQKLIDQFAIADGYWVGAVHAWRGEADEAFRWLERAVHGGDSSVMYLAFDPLLARVRDDPRHAALLAEIGLAR